MKSEIRPDRHSQYYENDGFVFEFVSPDKATTEEDLQKISSKLYKVLEPYINDKNMI